jgi:hypothetical protein
MTDSTPQSFVRQREIGVGDASHNFIFVHGPDGPRMDDQRTDRDRDWNLDTPRITSTSRERIFAAVLTLVYIAGWVLIGYGISIRIENLWPARVFWVVYATYISIMLVLPLVAACWFFGIDRSPAWMRGRFSLRALLIVTTLAAVVFGVIVLLTE